MSEGPKTYNFYRPRIQIPVATMTTNPGEWAFYCLPVDFAQAMQRIAPYLLREITYVGQYFSDRQYIGPEQVDLVAIRDLVEQGMVALMDNCGIGDVTAQLELLVAAQQAMMECICQMSQNSQQELQRITNLDGYVDGKDITFLQPSEVPKAPIVPGSDEEKCEFSQAIWLFFYDLYTTSILPWANTTADTLTAAIVATSTVSSIATGVGIPLGILTSVITLAVNWAIDGSIANFTNWLLATKDEIICLYYEWYPDLAAMASSVDAFIDTQTEISFLDRQLAKVLLGGDWWYGWIVDDQDKNGTWDAFIIPGFCDTCAPVPPGCIAIGPCVLGDWVGGSVTCISDLATIQGGLAYWDKESALCPLDAYLTVAWWPRTDGYPTAETNFGLTRVSDLAHYNIINGPPYPADILVIETVAVPAILWGNPVYFDMQQAAYWGSPVYWCLTEGPP